MNEEIKQPEEKGINVAIENLVQTDEFKNLIHDHIKKIMNERQDVTAYLRDYQRKRGNSTDKVLKRSAYNSLIEDHEYDSIEATEVIVKHFLNSVLTREVYLSNRERSYVKEIIDICLKQWIVKKYQSQQVEEVSKSAPFEDQSDCIEQGRWIGDENDIQEIQEEICEQ